jgi:hypothetical protein
MIQILLKALGAILVKLFAAAASEAMLEWLLFKVAKVIVDSTKTPHDNEWFTKFKEEYDRKNNGA